MKNLFSSFTIQTESLINGLKTGLACLLGIWLVTSANFYTGQWLIITIVVVMSGQLRLGGAIKKAYMRILGTISASIIAAATIYFLGTERWILTTVIILSIILFSYISSSETEMSEMGTLGGVTTVLILFNQPVSLTVAEYRVTEILSGIIIALLISSLIYPIYAKNTFRKKVGFLLKKMSSFYSLHLKPLTDANTEQLILLEDEIAKLFVTQNKLLTESKAEIFGNKMHRELLKKIIRVERRIYRAMHLVSQTLTSINYVELPDEYIKAIQHFNTEILTIFDLTANQLDNKKESYSSIKLHNAFKDIDNLIRTPIKKENAAMLIAELYAFQFCARSLVKYIHELEPLVQKFI